MIPQIEGESNGPLCCVRKGMRQLCQLAGVEYKRPHALRHGHAVWALSNAGSVADLKAVSQNLMHKSLSVTDGIYAILPDTEVQARIAALGSGDRNQAAGAAMGVIGVFSYLGAGLQELASGMLIERGTTLVDGVRSYDFAVPVLFWVGASVLSMLLAASLWRVRARE